MGVTIDTLPLLSVLEDSDFLLGYDQDLGDARRVTLLNLKSYLDLNLSDNADFASMVGNSVLLSGDQSILGVKTFGNSANFSSGFSVSGGSVNFGSSSVDLGSDVTFDSQSLSSLISSTNYISTNLDVDIDGHFTFSNGFTVSSGVVNFPPVANISFDGVTLSSLTDHSSFVDLSSVQDITGHKTFKNGFTVEKGLDSVTFPDKTNVIFGALTLDSLLSDVSNLIDTSSFLTATDLTPYALTSSLSIYVTQDQISSFINADYLVTALADYIDAAELQAAIANIDYSNFVTLDSSQNIVGSKTFESGFSVDSAGSVAFPQTSQVTFDGQALDTLLGAGVDLSAYVLSADLTTTLLDYVLSADLTTALSDYVLSADLSTTLSDYVLSADLTTTLLDYVLSADLTTALSDYVLSADLTTALSDYVLSADLTTTLLDYVLSADLTTTLSDYVLLSDSNDTAHIEEVTASNFSLDLSYKNKIIHFIPSTSDIDVSLDGSVADWEGFQCRMIHVGDDSYKVTFDFQINEESDRALSSKFSLINLYYYDQQSYWISYSGGSGLSSSVSYSLQLLGDNPYSYECGSGDSDPGANIYDPSGNLYYDSNIGSDTVYSPDWLNSFSLGNHSISYSWTDPSGNVISLTRSLNAADTTSPTTSSFSISSNSFQDTDTLDLNNFGIYFDAADSCATSLSIDFKVLDSGSNVVYPSSGSVTATYDVSMSSWSFDSSPATFTLSQGTYDLQIIAEDPSGNTSSPLTQSFSITGSPYYLQASSNLVCRFFGWNSMGPPSHATQSNFEESRDDTQVFSTDFDASSYVIQDRLAHGVGTEYGVSDPVSGAKLWLLGSSNNNFLTTEDGKDCIEVESSSSFYAPNIHVGNSGSAIQSLTVCLGGSNSRTICYWYRPSQHDAIGSSQDQYGSIVSLSNGNGHDSAIGMTASGAPSMALYYNADVGSNWHYYNWFSPGGASNNHARHDKHDSNLDAPRAHNENIVTSSYSGWSFFGFVYDGSTLIMEDDGSNLEDTTPAALKFFHGYDDGTGSTYFTTSGFGSDGVTDLEGGSWREYNNNYVGTLNTIIENFCIGKSVLNGVNGFSNHPGFSGYLHDLRIYDIALTSSDLQNIFESNEDLVN